MTLILSVDGRESLWMLADRRLSYHERPPRDDARKLMFLETIDGVAILGYAGLGATAYGTEPADWMSAVLRGRNLPLGQSLSELAGAIQRQIPKHLLRFSRKNYTGHHVVIPAFVNGEVRLYTIDLKLAVDRKSYRFQHTMHVMNPLPHRALRPPRICLTGSGAAALVGDNRWKRDLLALVRASDNKKVSPLVVADRLATINQFVHRNTCDGTVGPRCIVAWRHNKTGVHGGGGGHQFYSDITRDLDNGALPTIATGIDAKALSQVLMRHFLPHAASILKGEPVADLNLDKMDADVAKIPDRPDEHLK